jgi:hypothetical protein
MDSGFRRNDVVFEASPRFGIACEVFCLLFEFRFRRRRQTVGPSCGAWLADRASSLDCSSCWNLASPSPTKQGRRVPE